MNYDYIYSRSSAVTLQGAVRALLRLAVNIFAGCAVSSMAMTCDCVEFTWLNSHYSAAATAAAAAVSAAVSVAVDVAADTASTLARKTQNGQPL